jgi:hypothetical protein
MRKLSDFICGFQCCENCLYWYFLMHTEENKIPSKIGICKRFPPKLIDFKMQKSEQPFFSYITWCGEWKSKNLKIKQGILKWIKNLLR